MKPLTPSSIAAPFGAYNHGIATQCRGIVVTSGQLGLAPDGSCAPTAAEQAAQCFENIRAILAEAECGPEHVIRLSAFVTDRAYFPDYMAARDAFLESCPIKPASTLVIVSGFTRPEFLVEVEATAVLP